MFVLTALAAALSDLAIVYLGLRRPSDATDDNDSALLVAGSLPATQHSQPPNDPGRDTSRVAPAAG
eukprot:CAMPEP_0178613374 /NCGR_PEP_ID=MMETSP0698-20121128/1609_1 /TAXON_ID=265572 /ORGANISM="Extubocellulus spinifer, Strain CCMP396" /LENGTH=65 /DNA_ID=CAMNT_0020252063 /DNA_START=62 /DNA_END=256 /DNA_ORIENTATION=+